MKETSKLIQKAEAEIISSILNDSNVYDEIFVSLEPEDFSNSNYRVIFATLKNLYANGNPISKNLLIDHFNNNQTIQFPDYAIIIETLDNIFISSIDVSEKVELIKNHSISEKLKEFGNELNDVKVDGTKYNDQMYRLEKKLSDIVNSKKTSKIKSANEVAEEYRTWLDNVRKNQKKLTGITSGFPEIDHYTNGFQAGDLIILAARPGKGKTTLALNFLINAANSIAQNSPSQTVGHKKDAVLMFSLEMGSEQLFHRFVCLQTDTEIALLSKGSVDYVTMNHIDQEITNIGQLPILIDDATNNSILDIQAKLKQASMSYNIKLVVIDYLQLLKGPKEAAQTNRQQEVATISRMLKILARQHKTPIIAIAQLSRNIEKRSKEDQKPILSDLRESGAIEQDADLVTFIDYQEDENDQDKSPDDVLIKFIIAKHRNGRMGETKLLFQKKYGKYISIPINE